MRRSRITFPGATHHVVNRGHDGLIILPDDRSKNHFLHLLRESRKITGINIYAYCLMDNHYHLIMQNTNGRMSQFMKLVNGQYGAYYRQRFGGRGYVFQSRYHSALIQENSHLAKALIYVWLNPQRSGIVPDSRKYPWSSYREYFSKATTCIVNKKFVEDIFGSRRNLNSEMLAEAGKELELEIVRTRYGDVLGSSHFAFAAMEKHDRREGKAVEAKDNRRYRDPLDIVVERVIQEFEVKIGKKIEEVDTRNLEGKRQRAQLLVNLREMAGLALSEIGHMKIFRALKYSSLSNIYKNAKERTGETQSV